MTTAFHALPMARNLPRIEGLDKIRISHLKSYKVVIFLSGFYYTQGIKTSTK